jgi:FG-GAP repeat/FlgD Ig-like domain
MRHASDPLDSRPHPLRHDHARHTPPGARRRCGPGPAGAWSYGWAASPGGAFQSFTTHGAAPALRTVWSAANGCEISYGCGTYMSNGVLTGGPFLNARPGTTGQPSLLRWTAPADGTYHLNVAFAALGTGPIPPPAPSQRYGGQAASQLGFAVLGAGDVNGDGYADVLVSQPYYTVSGAQHGRVQLFAGGPGGISTGATWSYVGATTSETGTALAVADVNGDGYPDLAVGAPGFTGTAGANQGEVLVFLGGPSGFASTPAWSAVGATSQARFGTAVALGDVNGDGYADVLAGAPQESHGQTNEGRVYLWLGHAAGLGSNGTSSNAVQTSELDVANANFGASIAVIGDMNGDGKTEVLVGAPHYTGGGHTDCGWVGMYYGSTNGIESLPGFSFVATQSLAELGTSVAGAGDLNGDGYPDVIAGAPGMPGGGTTGQALVWLGGSLGITGTPITLNGLSSGSRFGAAVAGVGRIAHGAYPSVAVGAPAYSNGQTSEGAVSLFTGNSTGVSTLAAWFSESNSANASYGAAVAGVGDVNGDANGDLAIGATGFDNTLSFEGRLTVAFDAGGAPAPDTKARVGVWRGATPFADGTIDQSTGHDTTLAHVDVPLAAGQSVDIVVGGAGGDPQFADVSVDADVIALPPPVGPSGPVEPLSFQRFVSSRSGPAIDGLAFDPIRGHYASNGYVYDGCGTQLSTGPTGPAVTWDPVTLTYWTMLPDAGNKRWVVLRYSGANGAFVDTALKIPQIFTMPGVGPDTLEDARGLALDSSFVYVVDAGPGSVDLAAGRAPGSWSLAGRRDGARNAALTNLVPPQNEWLKFTRAGVPVAAKKGAAFSVNSTADVVDDIVCEPFSSPTAPGRLLVAIEHTGIDVLDRSGNLIDTFRWSAQGLGPRDRPAAFAGLAMDPISGDLWLADNDQGAADHWTRIPSAAATSYLVGTGSNVAYLHSPNPGCSEPLWSTNGAWTSLCGNLTLIFGIAYRPVDQRVYGVDYSDGSLWRFDPRSGSAERVAATGVPNIWGLAYDAERDLLVGHLQGPNQLYTIRPTTGVATPLPLPATYGVRDLGLDPNTHALYGVDNANPPHLVRFDRDSGAGTLIGNTHSVAGLEFDATIGALIGIDCCTDTLWRISTTNGAASFLRKRGPGEGWEGLAVIPVGAAPVLAVSPSGHAPLELALAAGPNPWHETVTLRFTIPVGAPVDVDVFDVTGRRVRRLVSGPLAAGEHVTSWDGRDTRGDEAGAGVYFARVTSGDAHVVRTLVRIR